MAATADSIQPQPEGQLPSEQVNAAPPAESGASASETESATPQGPWGRVSENFSGLSRGRQIQLIIALAAAVTLIVALIFWSLGPDYKLLYGKLSAQAAGEVVQALEAAGVDYKLDETSGEILVPADQVHDLRIKLAAQGLPKAEGAGYEMLEKGSRFGTSQFMEKARYHHALEGELARTIAQLDSVESARVHLAVPRQSVFLRERREPSASVLVNLKRGRSLDPGQVAAIVHLVASSVPKLQPERVTVVDQSGKMLTRRSLDSDLGLTQTQFEFKKKLEEDYVARIERILSPIIGFEGVRAQVDADVDFSITEHTEERYNPDAPALRSEHTEEEERRGGGDGGVPGALTNQPPAAGIAPEQLPGGEAAGGGNGQPTQRSRRSTFNYELDKTVSHTRVAPGRLRRLSVAVVVDDKQIIKPDGSVERVPLSPEELERITALVKEAVGFSPLRGDSLQVANVAFLGAQTLPPPPPGPLWEQPWFVDLVKPALGILAALLMVWLVVRPVLRALTHKEAPEIVAESGSEGAPALPPGEGPEAVPAGAEGGEAAAEGGESALPDWAKPPKTTDEEFETMLGVLRELVQNDPKLVAQVVKTWIAEDG